MLFNGNIFGLQRTSLYFSCYENTKPFPGRTAFNYANNYFLYSILIYADLKFKI